MARKRKPIVPMKYPVGQEYAYRKILLALTLQQKKLLKQHMAPEVVGMVSEVTAVHLPTGEVRQDAGWQETLNKILLKITKDMMAPTAKAIKQAALQIGPGVNNYNKAEWQRLIRQQYAVDPTREHPTKYQYVLNNWSQNNAMLIKDIPTRSMKQIADLTVESLRSGKTAKDMASEIFDIMQERMDVSDSRAKLIARDQVSKLNGNLTQERQTDMGVQGYIWRTVGDERVRETHDANNDQEFSWDIPPPETGHPGEDVNCRCWAEPILPERLMFEASLAEAEE